MERPTGRVTGAPDAEQIHEAAPVTPGATPMFPGWGPASGAPLSDAPVAEEMRPRTRLFAAGAEALSPAELLAVVLRAFPGTGDARAIALSGRLLYERGGLYGLLRSSPRELAGVAGIGEAKAAALLAAAELGKRMVSEQGPELPVISSPQDAERLLRGRMAHLDRERFVVMLLNTKNAVLATHIVSIGTLSSSLVHPREVFKPAVRASAAGLILAHNHPSGRTEPSREDRDVTRRIVEAGKTLGIEVLDHLVIGDTFFSFKEHGLI